MKRRVHHVFFPSRFVVVMTVILSAIFFANANLSFAATAKKKTAAIARTSAVDHTEARIKQLQGELKITEPQKELWNTMTRVMRENAIAMDALTKEKAASEKTMNAVEHLKFYSQISTARLDQLNTFIPTFEALYASMSDGQKKIADTLFRTGKHGKRTIK